jgi:AbrB family looped-hinge helix DNA binding protein
MPFSTMTTKGQTTVPKEIREALDLEPGTRLRWELQGSRIAVSTTTERPALYKLRGFIKHGPDPLTAIARARKTRGRF